MGNLELIYKWGCGDSIHILAVKSGVDRANVEREK